jgi:A/G-specific adenine glycosylase
MPDLVTPLLDWYAGHARDLPWRRTTDPWAVLVSEVMLQQTPVRRVLPAYNEWLGRWPAPAALASAPVAEALRAWGRLGYPRRALRLHEAATSIVEQHDGRVPSDLAALLALPGVGTYTARAVAAFAFGARVPVVDTNVRRVVARSVEGVESGDVRPRDLGMVEALLPRDGAPRMSVALMELGALVCTARAPRCGECPLARQCAWRLTGMPANGVTRRTQAWAGTDRQARGALMAVLRARESAVTAAVLAAAWPEPVQRARALDGLVADGLVEPLARNSYALPGGVSRR